MAKLLNMSGIGKAFSGVTVLKDVSFDLNMGEVHVLAGENGAGKSTLMKILSGVHRDYRGEIHLDERPVEFLSPQDANRHGVAMIHQELSLIDSLSVMDNVNLGREPGRVGGWLCKKEAEQTARAALSRVGLDLNVHRSVGVFPVSVRQLIEIARAFAFDARVLIMDEPTSTLNEAEVKRLFALINDLKKKCGIIYITHKMDEIYQLADRITVLRDGCHIATEPANHLPRSELVKKMVGREWIEQLPERNACPGKELIEVKDFSTPMRQSRGITFSARAGEIVGFAGLQGSGCSELFHGLFGSFGRAVKGNVKIDGCPYFPSDPAEAIHSGMSLLTNDRKGNGLIPTMSSALNMTLASIKKVSPRGWVMASAENRTAEIYRDRLHIRMNSIHQDVMQLSGGNQQKVVLAKWLDTKPRIFLLDEPTRGVDVGAKHEIYKWMNQWTANGAAILLITSELPELLAMSDHIIVMHRGEIRGRFTREEATAEKIMHAAMGE